MPIGLNEGNIGRSVCPGFGKFTYGSSLAKTSEIILETATKEIKCNLQDGNERGDVLPPPKGTNTRKSNQSLCCPHAKNVALGLFKVRPLKIVITLHKNAGGFESS